MKKILSLMLLAAVGFMPATAQDDDVYFVPSKSSKTSQKDRSNFSSQAERIPVEASNTYDNLYEMSDRDIDAYNRRYAVTDSIDAADDYAEDNEEGTYTRRLVRFHSPTVGVYVSSPYYDVVADYYWYDPWFSPWYYSPFYGPSYAWTWSPWAYDWYWGWGWHTWWHDPWYHHHHHYWYDTAWRPSFNGRPGNGRYIDTYRRVTADRPSRNYNYASGTTTSRTRPSRSYNTSTSGADRAGRQFGNSSNSSQRSSRSFSGSGNSNQSTQRNYGTTPSRGMGNSSVGSRSFGSGSSVGSGHSMGGSRSMGGGGSGRSFGGRR
ncbi:MAG: hypothetical protein SOU82_04955 [Alloprevotella sp.]|nr:hypothetical protein [Alloprevotella sp.]